MVIYVSFVIEKKIHLFLKYTFDKLKYAVEIKMCSLFTFGS